MNYDIAIVGCGPVGATLANLLGAYGYSIAIFEKEVAIYRAPRAVHIDDEVIRIFQAVGILDQIKDSMVPFEKMQFIAAKGKVLVEAGIPSDYQPYGHAPMNWFLQPVLEEKLRTHFQKQPSIQFYKGYEVRQINNQSGAVELTATQVSSQKEISVKSKYLIGCDGGKSLVRKTMSVSVDSLNFDQSWMVVDTFVKAEEDVALLPALHQQICDPYRPITYVPGVRNHRRFEFMLRAEETAESISKSEKIKELIRPFIAPEKLDIARSAVYTFHGLTANQWRKGRLLLAGDSAHQMPPFAGQGMCSGIRDAHNLAFKLDLVLKGLANIELLNSYEAERKPHVTAISKGAIKMGQWIQAQSQWKVWLRDFQFFLARNSSFVQAKMQADFIKKTPYHQGLLGTQHPLSGQLAIQPIIQTKGQPEILLDELLGNQFALISTQKITNSLLKNFNNKLGGKTYLLNTHFYSTVLQQWMTNQQMEFVIIRPDRYIYDAGQISDLEKVLNQLFDSLTT